MKKYKLVIPIFLALLMLLPGCPEKETIRSDGAYTLTILHNNDGESKLFYLDDDLKNYGGIAQFGGIVEWEKNYIESNNSGNNDVIMVSSGDNFLAGVEFYASQLDGTYYDAIALDELNYDAICFGNHDFDFGPEVLADFIKQVSESQATFLSTNLDFSGEPALRYLVDSGRIAKSVILKDKKREIGIIGAITPQLDVISTPRNVRVIKDVAQAVQAEVTRLEELEVDIIVLLSHMQNFDADIALANKLRGVDVMVAGGDDLVLANDCDLLIPGDEPYAPYPYFVTDLDKNLVPIVTTGGQYGYLGKLVVIFDDAGKVVDVDRSASLPIRIASADHPGKVREEWLDCIDYGRDSDGVPPEVIEKYNDAVLKPLEAAIELLRRKIADSQVALDGRESEVRSRSTNVGDLVADALRWQAIRLAPDYGAPLPHVAIINGGAIRNDSVIPAGIIRILDTIIIAPFANFVTVVEGVSREQFKEILENCVSQVEELDGRFGQISGFSFEWSATGTAQAINPDNGSIMIRGTRITKVVLDGGEVIVSEGKVLPGAPLNIATTDWQARGGDEFNHGGARFYSLGVSYQQALSNYITFADGL
ncbi:MAG TPA: bifunctional metallophosphatase/5'-nucleotidase, partial [Dehalococcoidia bacterium]|nr:bifunctional metallophosphatase/5'-nucleotidase [Dehalococcoidia bacterium]